HERVAAGAGPGLAAVAARAGAAVVARRAVGLVRVGALTAGRFAGAGVVALVERAADDRIGADTRARQAGIALRARIAVAARRALEERCVRAAVRGTAAVLGAGVAVVTARRRAARAAPCAAGVARRAGVAVLARGAVVRVLAPARGVARVVRAA